jgi:hypothetical protein
LELAIPNDSKPPLWAIGVVRHPYASRMGVAAHGQMGVATWSWVAPWGWFATLGQPNGDGSRATSMANWGWPLEAGWTTLLGHEGGLSPRPAEWGWFSHSHVQMRMAGHRQMLPKKMLFFFLVVFFLKYIYIYIYIYI